ncbi:uncharacterized protein B0T23DRAFT_170145 [Neurospora hispaniola]|uniref:Transmembrane protein n=1 Tax=Neurospora hispaniola TaxID=588809 RepID=A0AAJ0I676_9PEZI|nr:hypothetical protein B0T23DRAFT_170145 [Neurospora hispaniola]
MEKKKEQHMDGRVDKNWLCLIFVFSRNVSYILHSISLCINCIANLFFLSAFFTPVRLAITSTHRNPSFDDVAVLHGRLFTVTHVESTSCVFFSTIFKLCMYGKQGSRQKAMMNQ